MMKVLLIILFFIVICCDVFAQKFLNKNEKYIVSAFAKQGGLLVGNGNSDNTLFFKFPKFKNEGLYLFEAEMKNGICIGYLANYSGEKYKKDFQRQFNNSNSTLNHLDEFKWEDKKKTFTISIRQIYHNAIPAPGVTSTDRFCLDVRNNENQVSDSLDELRKELKKAYDEKSKKRN